MRILDISQPLRAGMPVWPGDQPYTPFWSAQIASGSSVNVGGVTLSLHTGTHTDAPLHVFEGGEATEHLPLEAYIGPVVVVEAIGTSGIGPEAVADLDLSNIPRVLFKTRHKPAPEQWDDSFAYLEPALARRLSDNKVFLVGIDTPSVDHASSKSLDTHHIFRENRIVNLENLDLHGVQSGHYILVALPLKITGGDASPVRAVLLDEPVSSGPYTPRS